MSSAVLPPAETLSAWQLFQYFRKPLSFGSSISSSSGLTPIRLPGQEFIRVSTPQAAQAVFAQDPNRYEAFWYESFSGLISEKSVWVLRGEEHRRERRLFAPATHASHFRSYGRTIREVARAHFARWRAGVPVKAIDTTKAVALDVIMRLVFGVDDEDLMDEGRRVLDDLTGRFHPFIVFYPKLQRPWFPWFRRYLRAKAAMYDWAGRLIALRRARGCVGDDVLGVLMTARGEDGKPFSEETICDELLSVLSAGHVTTAVALAWALYELGRNTQIAERLRDEIEGAGSEPDTDAILAMPYLSAVCNEAIRLHPILAECARVPIEPIEILGVTIPAGRPLVVSIVGIHHDPATYPEPGTFRPERFLQRTFSKTEFMPFGGGHRRCLGAGLAEYTMRIALAEAVTRWEFESSRADFDVRHDIALGPKYGVPLRVLRQRQPVPVRKSVGSKVMSTMA